MNYPHEWETVFTLKSGKRVNFRPIQSGDTEMLWKMFSKLSDKSLSNLAPPFTKERIERWTSNIDYDKILTLVAVVQEKDEQRIVGSASLSLNQREISRHTAELAIAVHDDFQNMGIGTALLKLQLGIAKMKRLNKIWLLVNTDNDRAVHIYQKAGFEIEGKLRDERYYKGQYGDEYRMAIFLQT
jgi:putative acetyltransferase